MLSYYAMDVHFDKQVDKIKSVLIKEEIRNLRLQIADMQEKLKYKRNELQDLVGQQLSEQCADVKLNVGDIIVNYEYGFTYALDTDLKLKGVCLNGNS